MSPKPRRRRKTRVEDTADLHDRLRALLLKHFPQAPVDELAAALAYELASVIATAAPTKEQAAAVLVTYTTIGRDQIYRLGVGKPHS